MVIGSSTDSNGTLNLAGFTLTKSGAGVLKLNGLSMSGAGNIVVNQGALQLLNDYGNQQSVSLTGTGTLTINPGGSLTTPDWFTGLTLTMPIILNGGSIGSSWPGPAGATIASPITLTANSTMNFGGGYGEATLSGVISGTGGLSISQDGTIFNPQQPLTFSGSNTYTGITKITGGTLQLGSPGALAGSTLDYSSSNGGVLSFGSQTSAVFGGLQGTQALALNSTATAAVALSVGNNDQNTLYLGELSGSGSLEKIGAGTLILSGSDSYSGGTLVSAGVLCVTNAYVLPGETNLTVEPGGTFVYDPSVTGAHGRDRKRRGYDGRGGCGSRTGNAVAAGRGPLECGVGTMLAWSSPLSTRSKAAG